MVGHGGEDVAFACGGFGPSGAVQLGKVDLDTFLGGVDVVEGELAAGVGVAGGVPSLDPVDLDEVGIPLGAADDGCQSVGGLGDQSRCLPR